MKSTPSKWTSQELEVMKELLLEVLRSPEGQEIISPVSQVPRLYTLEELSEQTGISLHSLREAVKAGDLVAARVGRNYRVTSEDMNRYLKKCQEIA